MDLAIAIVADWLGEPPTDDTLHTQFRECLALSWECHARFLTQGDGETCLIRGNDIQEFLAGRIRYITEYEPSMQTITCDGC